MVMSPFLKLWLFELFIDCFHTFRKILSYFINNWWIHRLLLRIVIVLPSIISYNFILYLRNIINRRRESSLDLLKDRWQWMMIPKTSTNGNLISFFIVEPIDSIPPVELWKRCFDESIFRFVSTWFGLIQIDLSMRAFFLLNQVNNHL